MIDLLTNGGISAIIKGVGNIVDDLITSDEERLQIQLAEKELDVELATGQTQVNAMEATHRSIFFAGWRPFIGWVCGFALGYNFLGYPLMIWGWTMAQGKGWIPAQIQPPPVLNATELYPVIMGMLGVGDNAHCGGFARKKTNCLSKSKKNI